MNCWRLEYSEVKICVMCLMSSSLRSQIIGWKSAAGEAGGEYNVLMESLDEAAPRSGL